MKLSLWCRWGGLTVAAVAGLLCSCQSAEKVSYLDPASNDRKIVRTGAVDQQDWGFAASQLTDSLLKSGVLDKAKREGEPNVVMISKINNKTLEHIEIDLLVNKISTGLTKSGKALVTSAIRAGGPEDEATKKTREELRTDAEFDQATIADKGTMKAQDYSLSGSIIESEAKAGKTTQSTFTFQLALTDAKTGLAVWRDEFEIVKQGKTKASVGW